MNSSTRLKTDYASIMSNKEVLDFLVKEYSTNFWSYISKNGETPIMVHGGTLNDSVASSLIEYTIPDRNMKIITQILTAFVAANIKCFGGGKMINNYIRRFLTLILITATLACLFTSCNMARPKNEHACEIEFGNYADGFDISGIDLRFSNEQGIRKMIEKYEGRIFFNPKFTDYSIAERFGFSKDDYISVTMGRRRYPAKEINDDKVLVIDECGRFSFSQPFETSSREYPFSASEIAEMGKNLLKEKGLWPEDVRFDEIVTEMSFHDSIIGRGVVFRPASDSVGCGDIQIEFDQNGCVNLMQYNWFRYESVSYADLIGLDEAVVRIKQGKAIVEFEDETVPPENIYIEIKGVSLSYMSISTDSHNTVMQPVYFFECKNSRNKNCYITVQANRV